MYNENWVFYTKEQNELLCAVCKHDTIETDQINCKEM